MTIPAHLMPDTIGVRRRTGFDEYGAPTYAATVTYEHCRDIRNERLITLPDGTVIRRLGLAMFSTAPAIAATDIVVLPDGTEARVLLMRRPRVGTGAPHHTTVEYG